MTNLLYIGRTMQHTEPRVLNRPEHTVGSVELAVLEAQHVLGCLAHEIEQHVAGRRVMRAVQELGLVGWHVLVALLELCQPLWVQGADRL